jgi:hypothetical protein
MTIRFRLISDKADEQFPENQAIEEFRKRGFLFMGKIMDEDFKGLPYFTGLSWPSIVEGGIICYFEVAD